MSEDVVRKYDVGDRVKLEATFRDDDGAPVNPNAVHLAFARPDGTTQTTSFGDGVIENPEAGFYTAEFEIQQSGLHRFRWLATGPGAGAEEGRFWANLNSLTGATP